MANAVITVLEADGTTETDVTVLDVGRQAAAASKSIATCTEDKAVLDAMNTSLAKVNAFSASASFTPAAASHTAGDCNGAAAEIDFSATSGRPIRINSATFLIAGGTAEATAWRLYLYNVTPPSATADDGAWDLASGDRSAFLGYIDLGTAVDLGSTQWVETHGINKQVQLSGDSVFAYLVNLTTLTPANVAHTVTLHAEQL